MRMSDPWLPYCFVGGILNICCGVYVLVRETAAEYHTIVEESLLNAYYTEQRNNAACNSTDPDDAVATLFVHALPQDTISAQPSKPDSAALATSTV